ncbi:MAG: hypothetical protein DI537_19110 [Stutzerimonas stutzeri]|nr:MAG: hypothetical protein DI537_19110 [Stutzerimonas stutzeri]
MLGLICMSACLAACSSTTKPASVDNELRRALGTALPGTRGATAADQRAIDETVAGGCAISLYRPQECRRHNDAPR